MSQQSIAATGTYRSHYHPPSWEEVRSSCLCSDTPLLEASARRRRGCWLLQRAPLSLSGYRLRLGLPGLPVLALVSTAVLSAFRIECRAAAAQASDGQCTLNTDGIP
eukprot:TRINITY_DN27916_c0_g1_i1.p1 TRINITY_DN27916_c0_g1~~TRINITY_DN27916_c0_g1_i1.p1  ORF type:complete len:107 (+),score=14.56 TRINITY_DN27916_c0_g1_i1:68-388(+)